MSDLMREADLLIECMDDEIAERTRKKLRGSVAVLRTFRNMAAAIRDKLALAAAAPPPDRKRFAGRSGWSRTRGSRYSASDLGAKMSVRPELLNWLASGDTGTSSKAIFTKMLGATETSWDTYPHDPADLGRCLRLLALAPEWAARIGEMAEVGHVWASLVAHWDELRKLYYSEVTGERGCSARKTYALMRRLIDDGLRADPLVHDIRTSDKGEIVGWSREPQRRCAPIRPTQPLPLRTDDKSLAMTMTDTKTVARPTDQGDNP